VAERLSTLLGLLLPPPRLYSTGHERSLGARVFLAGRTLESFEEVAEGIRSAGGVAETAQVDAIDEMAVDQHDDTVAASAGGIDVSFNLISYGDVQGTPLAEMPSKTSSGRS
jgi:NADP-dependent 3-hydroxy acid dehydrogenase YdfG